MKFIQLIFLIHLILGACISKHTACYTIEGSGIDSAMNGRYLYLQRYDDRVIIDSALVENQSYVFSGTVDTSVCCYIDTKSWSTIVFMLESGTIRIRTNHRKSTAGGTLLNDSWNCWQAERIVY